MILVDSDVLIAHLRGYRAARDWLIQARRDGPVAISVVSVAEVVGGMRSVERSAVWRLLSAFHIEPATELVARRAGELMRQYMSLRWNHDQSRHRAPRRGRPRRVEARG